jgi:hypothetical protein
MSKLGAVHPGFCDSVIVVNSAEFADFMMSADVVNIIGKSTFSASFSFLKLQNYLKLWQF